MLAMRVMPTTVILAIAALTIIVTTGFFAVAVAVTITTVTVATRAIVVIVVTLVAVAMSVIIVVTVMKQRTQRDKRNRRPDDVWLVIGTGGGACQGKQQQAS
jgi:amino acid transporter